MNEDRIKEANRIFDEVERKQKKKPKAKAKPKAKPKSATDAAAEARIAELAALNELAYQKQRKAEAEALGLTLAALDKLIRQQRAEQSEKESGLAHWNVEPWDGDVLGSDLLDELSAIFSKYMFLPKGAAAAAALWVLHAWTFDAGDISPFLTFVSPEKRCGKTSMLIMLMYLTPKSELASNISPSALYRYVEDVHPTLLIDEGDTFIGDNEELRGILNSGHTRVAANVIRNVEVNGTHKPRRFSTWTPKAIATIQQLADTLEDRAIIIQLRRKPKAVKVERLRKRDCEDFASLRRRAAKWSEVNFTTLASDADPKIPDELNDRAADNWRPLLQIADLAGGEWPQRARETACLLSGDDESLNDKSIKIRLLSDIRDIFGEDEEIRSVDLVAQLISDPEKPWADWRRGKPITQKKLAALLAPFFITSENVTVPGLNQGKGYKRARFEEAWASYLPPKSGQNPSSQQTPPFDPSIRPSASGAGTSGDFQSVQEGSVDGSKNDNLAYCRSGLDGWTDQKADSGAEEDSATTKTPPGLAERELARLAKEAEDLAYERRSETIDKAEICRKLAGLGLPPDLIAIDLRRVIDRIFEPRGRLHLEEGETWE